MNNRVLRVAMVALPLLLLSPEIAANAGPQPEHANTWRWACGNGP